MKINGKVKLAIAALVLAGCAFGGYHYYEGQQAAKQTAAVETTKAVRMDMKSTVSATGTIQPVDSVEVSSKITARLKSVLVKENDKVTAGQTVATLDAKDYEAKRDQAQYKVTNTQAEYDRISYLYSIGADTQKQLEDAQMNYDTAVSALAQAESDASETSIIAPIDGTVVGEHIGLSFYTLGQRKGIGVGGRHDSTGEPWFVARKDLASNTLWICQGHDHPWLLSRELKAVHPSWVAGHAPEDGEGLTVKTRYRQPDDPCRLEYVSEKSFTLGFDKAQWAATPGQSAVLYRGDVCLGGGFIDAVKH